MSLQDREPSEKRGEVQPRVEQTGDRLAGPSFQKQWNGFVTSVRQKKVTLGVCLVSAKLTSFEGDRIHLEFPKGFLIQKEQVEKPDSIRFLKRMLKKYFNREVDISCTVSGERAALSEKEEADRLNTGELKGRRAVEQQPIIKKIIEDFDGEIVQYHP